MILLLLFLLQFIIGGRGADRSVVATSKTAIGNLCPNGCSGRGVCLNNATSICKCFPGFTTPDCSQRLCPAARAWVDFPSANNTAHANFTECSNMGLCDRSTGICSCRKGFGGAACDMMLCPIGVTTSDTNTYAYRAISTTTQPCSGRGRCLSLREITQYQDYFTYLGYTSYTGWDEDMIHGCLCDTGWEGVACEKRSCPKGDDPLTMGANEVQLIDCQCSRCTGGIYISYNGQTTPLIPYDADDIMVHYYMSKMSSITDIDVEFLQGTQLCSSAGSVTAITFKIPQGPQNAITIARSSGLRGLLISVRSKGQTSAIIPDLSPSVVGTKEYTECSNHGVCNYTTGVCDCYGGYKSSDGLGNSGTIGDCGYRFKNYWNYTIFDYNTVYNASTNVNTTIMSMTHVFTNCPFDNNAICSGNGTCDTSTGLCSCYSGYGGPACSNRTCETSYTWFGNALASHTATSTCGGVGECDGDTGKCINCGGNWGVFTGDRCEHLSCYSDGYGRTCSDNGACMSMRHMAYYAYNEKKERSKVSYDTSWDADLIQGCVCYRAISVDNQYYTDYRHIIDAHGFNMSTLNDTVAYTDTDLIKFYRGPYAYAATDFIGYNCQQALCPKGDNPRTMNTNFSNEIQMLQCRAVNGTFTLTFRENTTLPISINDTASQLEYRLEQLYTIGDVSVTITGGNLINKTICNSYDNISVYIEFLTEFGDLPLLKADTSRIVNYGPISGFGVHYELVNITEYLRGDKEDIECSGMGSCDQSTGVCSCFKGFSSSNGTTTGAGQKGECSFYNIFYTEGS